jgi:isoquinoline 1-oxidoreductase beta subunit
MHNPHVPPGFQRGVSVNHNAIRIECFMDELAHAADRIACRPARADAGLPKYPAVLNLVTEKIGWQKLEPKNVHRGIAQVMGFRC